MVQAVQFRGSESGRVVKTNFELPAIKPDEVLVKVTHSGLCGSDLHFIHTPLVLGHEGVGVVQEVGPACKQLKVGDRVGWGPAGGSCEQCEPCLNGRDNYCTQPTMYGMNEFDTMGSICSHAVRKEQWVFKIPEAVSSEDAAPFMCGGGTVWTPLVEDCRPYDHVGIVALGGLGHLAVQFAAKMGCHVTVFSSTDAKRDEAMKLGAHAFFATKGVADWSTLGVPYKIDRLMIAASSQFDLGVFYPILAANAKIIPLSVDTANLSAPNMPTLMKGIHIVGSCICGRYLQTKMLDFATHNEIHSINEKFPMTEEGVNEAVEKLKAGKMRYRGVLVWEN